MSKAPEKTIRQQLIKHIRGGMAFAPIDTIIEDVEFSKLGIRPAALPYSFYELFYHVWSAQNDILEYCRNPDYEAPSWPDDYWPENRIPESEQVWNNLVLKFKEERDELCQMILNPTNDLTKPLANHPDHILLREIEIVIEHNAYHTGQLMIIKRLLRQ